jgi:hypothetical protein
MVTSKLTEMQWLSLESKVEEEVILLGTEQVEVRRQGNIMS